MQAYQVCFVLQFRIPSDGIFTNCKSVFVPSMGTQSWHTAANRCLQRLVELMRKYRANQRADSVPKEMALAVCSPSCQHKQCIARHLSPNFQQMSTYANEADEDDSGQKKVCMWVCVCRRRCCVDDIIPSSKQL